MNSFNCMCLRIPDPITLGIKNPAIHDAPEDNLKIDSIRDADYRCSNKSSNTGGLDTKTF